MTATPKRKRLAEMMAPAGEDLPVPPPTLAEEAATAVPTSAQGDLRHLAVAELTPSPHNPRKATGGPALAELVASVRVQGVQVPLLVRPVEGGFEVVAGHRRLAAARAAKVETVPCVVRLLTDQQAEELALVENVQRVDLTALEEGEGYRRLIKEHGYTLSLLAERVGKPKSTVAGRCKLAELTGKPRELVAQGELSASVGELVARLPTEEAQVDFLEQLDGYYGDLHIVTVADARREFERSFNLKLAGAPFDVKSDELLGTGGVEACSACPKRTGAQPDAFTDVKGDTCLDRGCWEKKAQAAHKLKAAELAAQGKKLLPAKEAAHLFDHQGDLGYSARKEYAKDGEKADGSKKTWKQLLGDATPVVVAVDAKGKARELVDKTKALELLKAADPKAAEKVAAAINPNAEAHEKAKKREAAEKRAAEALERVRHLVAPRIEAALAKVKKYDVAVLRLVGLAYFAQGYGHEKDLKAVRAAKKPEQILALVLRDALAEAGGYHAREADLFGEAAKYAGVDVKKLQAKAAKAEKGTCWVCGCTEEEPCKGGCSWVDAGETLCSKCGVKES